MIEVREPNSAPALEMAYVLFMDIVAYSKLHMDQQQRVINDLQAAVRKTSDFARAEASDQLIRLPTGDGMALVFFRDPEAPVRCALELNKILRDYPDIKLRMGIHAGPVYRIADINANRNVAGGGINIAQRVMDCGDSGHILVSAAQAEVLGQLSFWCATLHDLGEAEVKHGVKVHVYNLYTDDAGIKKIPQKIRAAGVSSAASAGQLTRSRKKISLAIAVAASVLIAAGAATFFFLGAHKVQALNDKDTIVLADFENATGDPVFDETLKQALVVDVDQSPFLDTLSDQKVRDTLQLMGRPAGDRLTQDLARQVCVRAGSKALLKGSISSLGSQYVIGLNAVNCSSGDSLALEQNRARGKDAVLDVLGKSASTVRAKLGESLGSIRKHDMPLEQVTTPSLEALQAFTLGRKAQREKGDAASISYFKRAIDLDPKFALAYSGIAVAYNHLGQVQVAGDYAKKAFELRDHVSERERLRITAFYSCYVTGETAQAIDSYELWSQNFPRDYLPFLYLGSVYTQLGQYDKAAAETQTALQLEPNSVTPYGNLARDFLALGQLDRARQVLSRAAEQKLDGGVLHLSGYQLAFLGGDTAGMAAHAAWAANRSGNEGLFLSSQSDTEAYYGRLHKARDLSRRAVEAAARNDMSEAAAVWNASSALRESEFGNRDLAIRGAEAALARNSGKQVSILAALTFARAGDPSRAQSLAQKLEQTYPNDSLLHSYWLPVILASAALDHGEAAKALDLLDAASSFDLADPFPVSPSPLGTMYPNYVRGQAYLLGRQGTQASAEFQKILDHPGIALNLPLSALARIGLARAFAQQATYVAPNTDPTAVASANDALKSRAREHYESFFHLWQNADPEIPILLAAKSEYAKLK